MYKQNENQLSLVIYQEPAALPVPERPDQRIIRDGAVACSNLELLQIIIGGPHAERAARSLLDQCGDLRSMATKSVLELAGLVHGVSDCKASRLTASFEIGKRLFTQARDARPQIKTPADAAQLLMPQMSLLDQEEVRTMLLDARNRVIAIPMIYRGSLNGASMRMGEVFKEAIRCNAASIVLAHNHPSGDPSPSAEDITVTKSIVNAGKLLDVEVLDHIIVGCNVYASLKERGFGFDPD